MAKYLRMQYRHWTLWCDRYHQCITPLLEDHSLHLMVKEDPWGRGEIGFYSSIQHSEWKAMLVNIDGELLQFVKSHIIFMFLPLLIMNALTLYTLSSVCVFSTLFFLTFPAEPTKRIWLTIYSFFNW